MWSSFLDRVNISFAALQMNQDLGFSPQVYGFAAGIFFLGYFLFEVPSNLMLQKVGARLWMCRICVTWGFLSMLTAFVTRAGQLLRPALSAGRGGGGALSRHGPLHDLLVSRVDAGALYRPVPGGGAAVGGDRRRRSRAGCWASGPWPARLAMDADPGRHSVAVVRRRDLVGAAGRSGQGEMAERGGEAIIAARLAAEPPGALHGFKEMLLDKRICADGGPGLVVDVVTMGDDERHAVRASAQRQDDQDRGRRLAGGGRRRRWRNRP